MEALHIHGPSEFLAAIKRLSAQPATGLREGTHLRLPVTMKIGDAYRCADLARNPSSVRYLRDENTFRTRLILRTVNEAWKHDKRPVLAICASERSAQALQKSAEIESVTAARFFSDVELARPVTQAFTARKNYVIGHDHNPEGRFDKIVLPANANVIVYEADKCSPQQLTSLCHHVREVRGRVILCADCKALDRAQPQIAEILNDFFGDYGPEIPVGTDTEKAWELGHEAERVSAKHDRTLESPQSTPWVVVAKSPWQLGANSVRSIHASQEEAVNAAPAVFAEEWKDYTLFLEEGWTDHQLPSVSAAEWRLSKPPQIGDSVRMEGHAILSLINLHERLPLPDALRQDIGETDPLANRRPFLLFHAKSEESTLFPDHYTLVARIEAESVEHALFLSRHTDVPWTRYRGVTPFVEHPRSTQVGDVIIDHDMPIRYIAPNQWHPAKTEMDSGHVHQVKAELHRTDCRPEAHEHQLATGGIKI